MAQSKSSRKKRARKAQRNRRRSGASRVSSLLAAAAAIPCLGFPSAVSAQSMPEESTLRFHYAYYEDWQEGNDERITVKAPMLWYRGPVAEKTELEVGFVLDTVSGASPLFHDTLSGASGVGIEDERHAGDVKVTQHFDGFSVGAGVVYSSEDDYDSVGGSLVTQVWTPDKNTTFTVGFSGNGDKVRSTNDPDLDETRDALSGLFGVTQVIDRKSLVQSNITLTDHSGYLSDPYKTADNRPSSRTAWAWLTRYIRYIESTEASLHADYRLYHDTWDIDSHTVEVKWYQPLGEENLWMLRPRLRYYTQDKAEFFRDFFPPENQDDFYTADQRLSGFGSITAGLKLTRDLGDGFSTSLSVDFVNASNGLALFTPGSPGMDDTRSAFLLVGFTKKFK